MVTSGEMRWVGHVTYITGLTDAHIIFVGIYRGKRKYWDIEVDRRIILKLVLERCVLKLETEF
jgi:hypothetical protein